MRMHTGPVGVTSVLAAALVGLTPTLALGGPAASPTDDLTSLVNPFIGTQNHGNTFPGAALPFGMVQTSPDTGGGGGYDYDRHHIYGFSQTHLSGVGCGVNGELPMLPTTGRVVSTDPAGNASGFSHAHEQASPGYYAVDLARYHTRAELTATTRSGWQRYTFPAGGNGTVLLYSGKANMRVFDSGLNIVGDRAVEGRVRDGHFCAGHDQHTLYFHAEFSRPFTSFGTWHGGRRSPGARTSSGGGQRGGWVRFDTRGDRVVTVKVGLSYTGVAGARRNLAAETADSFDFDRVRERARQLWNQRLHAVTVTGGDRNSRVAFVTALYHAQLHPNVFGDADGAYRGFDRRVHHADDYTPYANFSLWDTYRTQNQFLELIDRRRARDIDRSVLAEGREGGWLPRWALANSETNVMTGDPVTPFLVDGWSHGLLAGHEQEAYRLLRANATAEPPPHSPANGRDGNHLYTRDGYIPVGAHCHVKAADNDCAHSASATLEYAAADAALSLMARALGHGADARMFARRGQNYRRLWDASIGFFRPRRSGGAWLTPYHPLTGDDQFHEGTPYQYQWLVPQDETGLVGLLGGKRGAARRLDDFFAYADLLRDPRRTVRTRWVISPTNYIGGKTYNPDNEPDLQAPYSYLWTGMPDRTTTVLHAAATLFTNAPNGVTGNDDLGEMSAWLVMSSVGLYPVMSGADYYALSTPRFAQAVIRVGGFTRDGGVVVIKAPGVDWDHRYTRQLLVNDRPTTRTWVRGGEIASGGTIEYAVGTRPGDWGVKASDAPPDVPR